MHKDWTAEHKLEFAHHMKNINNHSNELRVGQKLSMFTSEEKAEAVKERMDAFDHATPEDRQKMIAEARAEAEKYGQH